MGPDLSAEAVVLGSGMSPRISGDQVVGRQFGGVGSAAVAVLDLATGDTTMLGSDALSLNDPDVSGDRVVWTEVYGEVDDRRADLVLFDLTTREHRKLTNNPFVQRRPRIDGSRVVWAEDRFGHTDIFVMDVETGVEYRLTTEPVLSRGNPDILGNRVVWRGSQEGVQIKMVELR